MFENFSETAMHSITIADEIRKQLDCALLGTEHLLIGLMDGSRGIAANVLRSVGVEQSEVLAEVKLIAAKHEKPETEEKLSPRSKRIIEIAWASSKDLGRPATSGDLLVAMLREPESSGVHVLKRIGVDTEKLLAQALTDVMQPKNFEESPVQGIELSSEIRNKLSLDGAKAISLGNLEAARFRQKWLTTEFLLFGLCMQDESIKQRCLGERRLDYVRAEVESTLGQKYDASVQECGALPLSVRTFECLDWAYEKQKDNDDCTIGAVDILEGILAQNKSAATKLLSRLDS